MKIMDKQIALDLIASLPDDISMEDIVETLKLIKDINNRINNFDRTKAISTEQLKKELKKWW